MHIRYYVLPLSLLATVPLAAVAVEEKPEGFIEGSRVNVLARNFYFNRDDRKGQSSPTGNGYSEAWAQGLSGKFESGFTQGTVGFGLDAFVMVGVKLDSGTGRSGGKGSFGVLPVDSDNRPEDAYSKVGGAAKLRVLDTVIKAGDVFPLTPVVAYGDSRVLPESFRGVTLQNTSFEGLSLQGGRLSGMSQPTESGMDKGFSTFYAGPVDSPWIGYVGGDYNVNKHLSLSLYGSRLKDAWNQYYAGGAASYPLSDDVSLFGTSTITRPWTKAKGCSASSTTPSGAPRSASRSAPTAWPCRTSATTATTTSITCASRTRSSSTTRSSTATSTRPRSVHGCCAMTWICRPSAFPACRS